MDLSKISIFEAVHKIKSGELKSRDLVEFHLNRAKTLGMELNAFITICEDALTKADEVDARVSRGEELGKLAGIPFTVKDVIMTKGVRTTAASQILKDFVAPYDATAVKNMLAEDAIIIGKTNCDPFAFGGSGENSGFGPALNPLDRTRVPGGSSSGAAAAMAAGIGLFALGTDTGGSVRQPAAFCGLVGYKPTYGRNSRYGVIAMASSFDTLGVFTHTVREAAFLEQILVGKDPMDATTYDVDVPDFLSEVDKLSSFAGVKVGVPAEYFEQGIHPEVKEIVENTIEKMKSAGAEIVPVSIPLLKYGVNTYYVLVPSEISSNMARYDGVRFGVKIDDDYEKNMKQSRGRYLEPEVKRRIMIGTYALSSGYGEQFYMTASKVREKLKQQIDEVFAKVDVIVGPTSPCVAFKLGEKANDPLSMYLADVYTVTANLVGCPGISINCGYDSDNMPVGFQLMTKKFQDDKLFAIANQVEKLTN